MGFRKTPPGGLLFITQVGVQGGRYKERERQTKRQKQRERERKNETKRDKEKQRDRDRQTLSLSPQFRPYKKYDLDLS